MINIHVIVNIQVYLQSKVFTRLLNIMRHLSDLTKSWKQPLTIAGIFTFKPNEDDRDGEVPYHSREKIRDND